MELIGHKSAALLDLWSLCHFFVGVAIGNFVFRGSNDGINDGKNSSGRKKNEFFTLFIILALAYAWELLEFRLEAGDGGEYIAYWLQGREYWLNRLLSDPFLVLIGSMFSRRFQLLIWPARVILVAWIWLFAFIFPHSMAYL